MKSNFSVKAILRIDKVLKNGNSPIFILKDQVIQLGKKVKMILNGNFQNF